jgi:hypothetical protein
VDEAFRRELEAEMGEGVSTKPTDRACWLDDIDDNGRWYNALHDIDWHDDKTALLALLRSDEEIPASIRGHLAEMLERYNLRRRQGRQRTPSYDRTSSTAPLEWAKRAVRDAVKGGMQLEDALAKCALAWSVSKYTLRLAYKGQLGGMRAVRKSKPRQSVRKIKPT